MKKLKIYTFWQGLMPSYIKLCLTTFKNSGYDLVVLNHSNLHRFITSEDLPLEKISYLPLAAQSDIICAFLMNRTEGIFLDTDTIFLKNINYLEELLTSNDLVMVGDKKIPFCHVSFILSNGKSSVLKEWEKQINKILNQLPNNNRALKLDMIENRIMPNSFGNPILDPIISKRLGEVKILEKEVFLPEIRFLEEFSSEKRNQAYNDFYFSKKGKDIQSAPFLLLHNSWTPNWYKDFSVAEIQRNNLFLSRLLTQYSR